MTSRMRPRVLLQEIITDVIDGTARTLTWMLLCAAIVLPLALSDLLTVHGQVRHAYTLHNAGAAVYVLSAPGAVDGRLCEALAHSPGSAGTASGGAIRKVRAAQLDALPGTTLPLYEATSGLASLLAQSGRVAAASTDLTSADHVRVNQSSAQSVGGDDDETPGMNAMPSGGLGAGVLLGEEAAQTLLTPSQSARLASASLPDPGSSEPASVSINGSQVSVIGSYPWPNDGRQAGYSYAAIAPVPAQGMFDECWISAWPARTDLPVTIRSALSPAAPSTTEAQVSQLNYRLGQADNLASVFSQRITRFNSALLALGTFIVGWLSVRLRRLELASDLNVGVSRLDLSIKVLSHTLMAVLPATTAVLVVGIALAWPVAAGDRQALILMAVTDTGIALACSALGSICGALLVKESALMHYSRDRT